MVCIFMILIVFFGGKIFNFDKVKYLILFYWISEGLVIFKLVLKFKILFLK